MEQSIQNFTSPEFGEIRTVQIDGEPWLVGIDVCNVLGYKKAQNAIATHVDPEDKTTALIQGTGSNYKSQAVLINESGFYSLVMGSKLPRAKEFKRWVTSEVLPSIRKINLIVKNGTPVVSSRTVAEVFDKQHAHVLRDIENICQDQSNFGSILGNWYTEGSESDSYGRQQKVVYMNRDGFSLLAMGFTGKKALQFKVAFINRFNEMERQLASRTLDSYMIDDRVERAKRWIEEEQERQRLLSENRIMKPKAQVYDEFVEKGHLIGFRDLAKQLKIKETMLREILFNMGWCYRGQNGKLQPYKIYCDAGYLTVKDVLNKQTGYTGTRCLFTIQGRDQLKKVIDNVRESEKETSKKKKLQSLIDKAINQPDDELEVG